MSTEFQPGDELTAWVTSLFTGAEQAHNFNRMEEIVPTCRMEAPPQPFEFPTGSPLSLPKDYQYEGQTKPLKTFLEDTDTSALIVLKDGAMVFEDYWLTGGRDVTWISMSVAKSFISALIGIAVSEGRIASIEEPVTQYVPELEGSAYDGIRIKDILQMSSGARWNEDYSDPDADIVRLAGCMMTGSSINEFVGTLESEKPPGTYNQYNSSDTQVLGMLLVKTTGRSITDYMREKLWHPMGAESHGFWMVDNEKMELAYAGFNAIARDYVKLGEMFRNGGQFNGQQIVPADWVAASVTPDAPHLQPGKENLAASEELGYGYQWWIPEGDEGEYSAIGVYNQFVYVNPTRNVVIAKLSANRHYGTTGDQETYREMETFEVFRAIVNAAT